MEAPIEIDLKETINDPASYWPVEIEGSEGSLTTCIRCRRFVPHPLTKSVSTRIVETAKARSWKMVGRICEDCLLVIGAGGRIE